MFYMTSVKSVDQRVAEMATFHSVFVLTSCDNFVINKSVNRNRTVIDSL